MASHCYHPELEGYDPDSILHDGCEECDQRAQRGVAGLLALDAGNLDLLWRRMLNTEYGGMTEANDAGEYRSDCESRLGHQLYFIGILLERLGEDVWQLNRFAAPVRS
jgi:hypothetical protein